MIIDERDVFIRGRNVFLKVLTKEDVLSSSWYGWFNDEKITATLQKHYFPNSLDGQLVYLDALNQQMDAGSCLQLGVCRFGIDKVLGVISLNNIDHVNRKAEISAVMGEIEGRDVKTIVEAWRLLFWHGFNVLNLHRIYGGSISSAVVDLMCRLAACNREGTRREDVYKNGEYLDVYEYGVLKRDFNDKYFDVTTMSS